MVRSTSRRSLLRYGRRGPSPADFANTRGLDKKSYLRFHFPNGLVASLPFYENIDIKEDKKAKIVSYNPIGRSSSLYAYTGAESRRLKINFALTLPHLESVYSGQMWRFTSKSTFTREQVKEHILNPDKSFQARRDLKRRFGDAPAVWANDSAIGDIDYENMIMYEDDAGGYRTIVDQETMDLMDKAVGAGINPNALSPKEQERLNKKAKENFDLVANNQMKKLISFVAWWVNLIRSSVLNNQEDITQGPPVVRLNHGPLYNDIPCICKSYSISFDGPAGFDVKTLMSRRILISMDLEEFRAGDFGDYKPGVEVKRDNVTGWESVIKYATTDPGVL